MLKDKLSEWMDVDMAQHELAKCLGIFEMHTKMREYKGVYWCNNDWGDALYDILMKLVSLGVLEKRDEPDIQFRWKESYNSQEVI
jgi:hypothetical protein